MMKRILFFQKRGTQAHLADIKVDLETLSPLARWIAEVILTTDWRDAAGHITVSERLSREQVMRRFPRRFPGGHDIEAEIRRVRAGFGEAHLQGRDEWTWDWDSLGHRETGEQYLERHAAEMLAREVDVIEGPNFGFVGRDGPPPTALRVMSAGSPEAKA